MFRMRRRSRDVIGRCNWQGAGGASSRWDGPCLQLRGARLDEVRVMGEAPWDVEELLKLGRLMEAQPAALMKVAKNWLRIRDREGMERPLRANAVQRAFEREYGRQNIVLKATQMVITTSGAG